MKFRKCAIPLYVPKSERITYIGTGFLARRRGEVGLLTAAHVPLGIRPFETAGWVGWPHEMLAVPDLEDAPLAVQMFASSENGRAPAFSYEFRNEATGYLRDMLGFFDPVNAEAIDALQETFEVIDLESETSEPKKGAVVMALGYPDRGGESTWPYASPRRCTGPFERVADDGLLEATIGATEGFAGAPAFTEGGEFVGMVAETSGGSARIHSRQDLLSL